MKQGLVIVPIGFIAVVLLIPLFLLLIFVDDAETSSSSAPNQVAGIPQTVLAAYVIAAGRADDIAPGCEGMTWSLVAGIGNEESDHATLGGAEVDEDGNVAPEIFGPRLDGSGDLREIEDTDDGDLDDDEEYDRAVGPMQFIPGSWETFGQDGDDDGEEDPHNIFDATAAAVAHLCSSGDNDLTTDEAMRRAVRGYNNSDEYVDAVMERKAYYDSLHVGPDGAEFADGTLVDCADLGQLHPYMCGVHEHLQERFGRFYVSAGGRRNDPGSDHHTGEAIDYMMADLGAVPTPERDAMAILVINYVIANHEELNVKGLIYNFHIWNAARDPVGDWTTVRRPLSDRGSITQNHVDHIHLAAGDGGMR
ncbi:hypothetical protein ACIBFB_05480 [Nocardiopsis sp. NPDC050513]|uniref:hypothetical protein n=1 Tax=Nocardiopsis sp. NPDC050513 TaxID=3364338 RepID=UPI00378BFC34